MNRQIKHHFPILGGYLGYLGTIFAYETESGLRWSHSLQNHGAPLLETSEAAIHDFWDIKNRLPQHVHDTIFGRAA